MKVYIILENAFEYNDEGYYRRGLEEPISGKARIFTDRHKAESACAKMNMDEMKKLGTDIRDYDFSDGFFFEVYEVEAELPSLGGFEE